MRVRLLGGLVVDGVAGRDLGSRKARTLLKVLALARGAPVGVDTLADVLWGDEQPARPADQVGVLVSRLRRALDPDRLTRTDAGYALAGDWLDVDEVGGLAATAASALAEGRVGAARAAAEAALSLVRGPLIPDEDGAWAQAERAAAEAAVARARAVAVAAALAAGDHTGAAALAEAALAHDPYDEAALRALMRAHLAAGRPASALGTYARVRRRLVDDLGVSPTAATEALYGEALAAADGTAGPDLPGRPPPAGGRWCSAAGATSSAGTSPSSRWPTPWPSTCARPARKGPGRSSDPTPPSSPPCSGHEHAAKLPRLELVMGDRGFRNLAHRAARDHGVMFEVRYWEERPEGGFKPIRPMWRVEDTFARLGAWRRLSPASRAPPPVPPRGCRSPASACCSPGCADRSSGPRRRVLLSYPVGTMTACPLGMCLTGRCRSASPST